MFRRLSAALAAVVFAFLASTGVALAAADVNTADQTQLESIRGIGPAISAKIIAERQKGGFKDWNDLVTRVPGIGEKNSAAMSQAGLTVGGQSKANAPMAPAATRTAPPAPVAAPAAPAPSTTARTPAAPVAEAKTTETTESTKRKSKKDDTSAPATTETKTTTATKTAGGVTKTETKKSKKVENESTARSEMAKPAKAGDVSKAETMTGTTTKKKRSKKDDTDAAGETTTKK